MKKILFPTDFSSAADAAFTYAIFLADKMDATIHCLHVYNLTHAADMLAPSDIIAAIQEEEEDRALEQMEVYHRRIEEEAGKEIQIKPVLKAGFAADAIGEVCKTLKPDLVVMGTKGVTNALDKMLGSVTTAVIQTTAVPLLAIPESAIYSPIKRIAYATDFREKDHEVSARLGGLASSLDASVIAVHVASPGEANFTEEDHIKLLELYRKETGLADLDLQQVEGKDTADALAGYMELQQVDVLALSTHRRSFLDRLFHRSLTRRLALYASKPLLVFHS